MSAADSGLLAFGALQKQVGLLEERLRGGAGDAPLTGRIGGDELAATVAALNDLSQVLDADVQSASADRATLYENGAFPHRQPPDAWSLFQDGIDAH
jgi:hypothetical protein